MSPTARKAVYLDPAWAPDPTGRSGGIERARARLVRHLREAHGLDARGDEGLPLLEYWHRLEHAGPLSGRCGSGGVTRMDLPRFPADLPAPPGVPDGIYSTAEGQYRLAVRDGRVVWTAVILGGDAEDYLAGCASARPMSPAEAEMTIRFALTSHDWGRTWAEAIAQGGEGV